MNIEANEMIQYSTMILGSTGIIAFLVSAVVQTIKDLPVIGRVPTSVVAFVVSLVLCPVAVICYCSWRGINLTWYIVAGAIAGSFPVYLIATGGWEKLHDIWKRTQYTGKKEG